MPSTGPTTGTDPAADAIDLVRRRVVNVVGHELRTPITTVRGLAELLVDADADEARDVIIPALIRNARRSEELLDDLLIVSEVTTAHPVEAAEPFDLRAAAEDAVRGTAVTVEGDPAAAALGHRPTIVRALRHLTSNADRYHDGPPTLRFEVDGDLLAVVVRTPVDHRVGDVDLTFEVFFRGEAAVTRSAGIGVGLPAARALARIDGGDVDVHQGDGEFVARLTVPRAS